MTAEREKTNKLLKELEDVQSRRMEVESKVQSEDQMLQFELNRFEAQIQSKNLETCIVQGNKDVVVEKSIVCQQKLK